MFFWKFALRLFFILTILQCCPVAFSGASVFAEGAVEREEEQVNEGLDLIAERMEELSQSLEKLPEPPILNQTLEILDLNNGLSQKKKIVPEDLEK